MAEMPTVDSVMQPIMTFMPRARARAIMRRAGVIPPHLVSLMLMPWKKPRQRSTSSSTRQLSSAITGRADSANTRRIPSQSSAGSGCSMNSTPSGFSSRRIGDGLLRGPGAVGVDAEDGRRVPPQLAHDRQVVGRAELDLVDRPAVELLHLHDHRLDRVDADGVVAQREVSQFQAPQAIDRLAELLAPQVVRRLVHGAEREALVAQHGQQPLPQRGRIVRVSDFDAAARGFQRLANRGGGHAVVRQRRPFAVAASSRPRSNSTSRFSCTVAGAVGDREGVTQRQTDGAEAE